MIHASASMPRSCVALDHPGRRKCSWCKSAGARKSITHAGQANGVTLMVACEWHVRRWVRDPSNVGPKRFRLGDP